MQDRSKQSNGFIMKGTFFKAGINAIKDPNQAWPACRQPLPLK